MKALLLQTLNNLQDKYSTRQDKISLVLIVLLSLNFIVLGIHGINLASNPEAWDTTAYLGEANFIKNSGGLSNFLSLCFSGKYLQANQHPLYILLITPFASTDISFFIAAKYISLLIGLIFLILFFILVKRKFGDLTAALSAFALIQNTLFMEWSTIVATESLLVLFSFLCMFFIMLGFSNNKNWVYAGIFAGLAYFTKGTSIILLPGFVFSAFIVERFKIFSNKYFWSFFLLFGLVASPLLIRNVVVYNNPFFNVNNYIVTYGIDKLDEYRYVTFSPNEGATLWKFEDEINDAVSQSTDNESFSILNLTKKIFGGVVPEFRAFSTSFNLFGDRFNALFFWMIDFLLLVFFIIGFLKKENLGSKIYFVSTVLTFFAILSFNPIDRYFLPLVPFIWIYIAFGIFSFLDLITKKFKNKSGIFNNQHYLPYTLIAFFIFIVAFNVYKKKTFSEPLNRVEYSESRLDLLNWLKSNLKEGEKYTLGPNFNWQLDNGIWILPPQNSKTKDFAKFNKFIRKHNVSYIIIERNSLNDKMELIENNFALDPNDGVIEKKSVEGWELVYKDYRKPTDFLVYKLKI